MHQTYARCVLTQRHILNFAKKITKISRDAIVFAQIFSLAILGENYVLTGKIVRFCSNFVKNSDFC